MHRTLVILFVLLSSSASSGEAQGRGYVRSLLTWDRWQLRHNLNTRKEVPQPAFFQVTDPAGRDATVAVGVGLSVALVQTGLVSLGPLLEYQRNTETDKEQDVIKAGAALEWQVVPLTLSTTGALWHSSVILGKLNYKNDRIKLAKSFQLSAFYTHVFSGGVLRPNASTRLGAADLVYSPQLGFEYEEVLGATADSLEGTILRGVGLVDVYLYPAGPQLDRRLELAFSYAYRLDLVETTGLPSENHPLLKWGVTAYFLKEGSRKAGVGLTYVNGQDPNDGLRDQEFWQFAVKFQI